MESLALAAAVVMLVVVGSSLAALASGLLRLRVLSWIFGFLSIAAGGWLLVTLPHMWFLPAWCIGVGIWAISRIRP